MDTRKLTITLIGGFLTIVLVFFVGKGLAGSKKDAQKPPIEKVFRKVRSALVDYSSIVSSVTSNGRVISQQSVDVISEVQGKLLPGDIPLKKGQEFREGDILVRIFNKDAAFAMQARKSGYLNLLANILPDLKIDYNEEFPLWVEFFESVETTEDLPDLPEVKTSQLKIFLASRNILSEYYAIKSDEIRLRKYSIVAPYDGAIQNVLLEVSSVANPGSRIAQIIKTSQLEIEVPMEATAASWLHIGDRAVIRSENGEMAGEASIRRISSFVDESTQSINIYLSVIRQDHKLFPGEYLKVEFAGLIVRDAMEIPRNAVFNRNMVFTVEEGYLSKKSINLLKLNEKSVIFNGLEAGAEVVTEPLANASESMQVQTEYSKPALPDSSNIRDKVSDID